MDELRKQIEASIESFKGKSLPYKVFKELTFDQVDLLSRMLRQNIENYSDIKNPNDYNFDLVSSVLDKAAMLLMESGQKKVKNGDVLNFLSFNENLLNVSNSFIDLDSDIRNSVYDKYPYNLQITSELRIKSLLNTESREDFADLYSALKISLKQYLSEEEVDLIDLAIKKAQNRIFNNKLKFLNPIDGTEQGKMEKISIEDYNKYGLDFHVNKELSEEETLIKMNQEFKFDVRSDNFDILALKNLLLVLNHTIKFDYFSVAPGFFNKIMPELKELGVDAVIFKVSNEKVEDIKLVSLDGRNHVSNEIQFSPLKSSLALLSSFASDWSEKTLNMLDGSKVNHKRISKFDESKLDNSLFYITVDGAVAGPSIDEMEIGYKKASFNTVVIPAGETFLFEKRNGLPMLTRMYFTPYSYEHIHIVHHHGSVIWGQNDHSLHSCCTAEKVVNEWEEALWHKMIKDTSISLDNSEMFSPAMIAASNHIIEEDKSLVWQFFVKQKYWDKRYLVTRSILEMCNFTPYIEMLKMNYKAPAYNKKEIRSYLEKIMVGYAPLHKRFNLNIYLNENKLSYEQMPTLYNKVSLGKSKTEAQDALDLIISMKEDNGEK